MVLTLTKLRLKQWQNIIAHIKDGIYVVKNIGIVYVGLHVLKLKE